MSNLNTKQDSEFVRAVDDIANGADASKRHITLGTTPDVLTMIGLPETRINIRMDTIQKAMGEYLGLHEHNYSHIHNLTPETLKQIPEQLNNPIAVMKSAQSSSNPNGFVVLTELTETDKKTGKEKPVVAILDLHPTNQGLEVMTVRSVYGRSLRQIEKGLTNDLLYLNTTKGSQFAKDFRLQLPSDALSTANLASKDIKTNADLMQYREEKKYNNPNLNSSQTGAQGLVLEEFGAANYQFNKNNEMSFYVKVRDENNKLSTIWGVGLEEAINTAGAKKNDLIYLKKLGKEKVFKTLKVPVFDQNGLPVFDYENNEQVFEKKEKYVDRNIWDIQVLQPDENLEQKNVKTSANQAYSTSQKQSESKAKTPVIHSKIINSEYQKLLERSRDFLNLVQERKLEVSEYEQFMGKVLHLNV